MNFAVSVFYFVIALGVFAGVAPDPSAHTVAILALLGCGAGFGALGRG